MESAKDPRKIFNKIQAIIHYIIMLVQIRESLPWCDLGQGWKTVGFKWKHSQIVVTLQYSRTLSLVNGLYE